MGAIFGKPREQGSYHGPAMRTPLSDISGPVGHWDMGECAPFELNFLDCMEAYGHTKGEEKCSLYFQDFMECTQKWKQVQTDEGTGV
jgi:hypothetical protein